MKRGLDLANALFSRSKTAAIPTAGYDAIVDEARNRGMPVAGHVHDRVGLDHVLDIDVSCPDQTGRL